MKKLFFFSMLVLIGTSFSCKRDRAIREEAANSLQSNGAATDPTGLSGPMPGATAPAAGNVAHYICPNNCAGSGGESQANCPVCGTAYVHNQAFHAQQPQAAPAPSPTTLPTPTAEPAQNAAGVWHYTCAKGCAGGSGSAGVCATCGGELAHNSSYHN